MLDVTSTIGSYMCMRSGRRFILNERAYSRGLGTYRLEWLRCSVGPALGWALTCAGEIVNLSLDVVPQALDIAGEQLGGTWRLPSKAELHVDSLH
ncbi:MAG: hypothetical protein ACJZ81_03340 [Paracoccaceae bacterium]